MPSDTTPLLPQSQREQAPREDSHPITLRACHSPWINQKLLFAIRSILTSYLTSVAGVALKYKLGSEDDHSNWRIPFQFSTVSFVLQWIYHLITLAWTGVHTFQPDDEYHAESTPRSWHQNARGGVVSFFSPPRRVSNTQRHSFGLFYTISHVFAFLNALLYWIIHVPSGHGGFPFPEIPHHRHAPSNSTTGVFYDPHKGLFEEDGIKSFSILNVWSITAVIAFIEMVLLNSIRRPTPVIAHVFATVAAGGLYIAWAGIGKLATDHWGLFFLDPKLMGNSEAAAAAAGIAFVASAPVVFTYVYGLIAMRETIGATH
ncbi:hypothetical protein F4808DRAFT_123347 [Astrocystis sublimbata]|nr:hypothetical protein F4808DRAFT_123347 [Astrocystis sublimbata]